MSPTISVFTASYNKPEFVLDAIDSVINQNFTDWDYWIIENSTDQATRNKVKERVKNHPQIKYIEFDFTPKERQEKYIPAYIINQVYPELEGKYIYYLSDDDLVYSNCFKKMLSFFDKNQEAWVVYHGHDHLEYRDGKWNQVGEITAHQNLGLNTDIPVVDCKIDGGQIMHKNECLDHITYPYFSEELVGASHCDGTFMQQLANKWTFYAHREAGNLGARRFTPRSTWAKPSR